MNVQIEPVVHSTYLYGDSEVSWDGEARMGFVCVEHTADPGCAWASVRTVELPGGINIDLDGDGRIRGIETFHEVTMLDLLAVIRWANDQRVGGESNVAE